MRLKLMKPLASIAFALLLSSGLLSFNSLPRKSSARAELRFSTGSPDDPGERDRWFWEQRVYPRRTIPVDVHREAIQTELASGRRKRFSEQAEQPGASWTELGPAPSRNLGLGGSQQDTSGRALAVAVHPTDTRIVLLGTAQGGIWRSADGGGSFAPVSDNQPSLAVKVVRFAPGTPSIVYAGTGEPHSSTSIYGVGVLKSTDAGLTWQALPISGTGWSFQYTAVTGLQVDPAEPNTVYVTTAIVDSAVDQFVAPTNGRPQTGIFKSTDGGNSWNQVAAATAYPGDNSGFMDLEMGSATVLYASEMGGGIYRTSDAGATWERVTPIKANNAGGLLPAPVPDYNLYVRAENRFVLYPRLPVAETVPDFSRIEISVSPANPDTIYAGYALSNQLRLDVDGNGSFDQGSDVATSAGLLFRSQDGGNSWVWLGDWPRNGVPDYCADQCDYDNTVVANPANASEVLIGGSANYNNLWPDPVANPTRIVSLPWRGMIYRSLDGGTNWVDTTPHCGTLSYVDTRTRVRELPLFECPDSTMSATQVIHPDIQGATFEPGTGRFYVASDGGLNRGSLMAGGDAANSQDYRWENLNANLATLQFYRIDVHPTNPDIMLGSLQDNACAYFTGNAVWESWGSGDGSVAGFDPLDPKIVYYGPQNAVYRHDNNGSKDINDPGWVEIISRGMFPGEQVPFIPVFRIDPVQSNILYTATNAGLYRSINRGGSGAAADWARLGDVAGATTIAVSPLNNSIVWYGTGNGQLGVFDGSALVDRTSPPLPGRFVSRVEASFTDANAAVVIFSGYNSNTPGTPGKVFQSTDLGQSWTDISGNLPDVPLSALALDPTNPARMWVGADIGVFVTTDGGATWSSLRGNMPVVAVMDMKYNPTTGFLTAATHGRGAWRMRP